MARADEGNGLENRRAPNHGAPWVRIPALPLIQQGGSVTVIFWNGREVRRTNKRAQARNWEKWGKYYGYVVTLLKLK